MIISLLIGTLIGFVLALPPGPMAMGAVKVSLDKGVRPSILFAAGSGAMDIVFCFISILAASALQSSVLSTLGDSPLTMLIFQIIVISALVAFGIASWQSAKRKLKSCSFSDSKLNDKYTRNKVIDWMMHHGAFLFGVAFALINLANPTFLTFLTFLNIQVHKFNLIENTPLINLLYSVGFGFGTFIWIALLSHLVLKYRETFGKNFVARVSQFASVTFFSFAGLIGIRVLTMTKWADLLRLVF